MPPYDQLLAFIGVQVEHDGLAIIENGAKGHVGPHPVYTLGMHVRGRDAPFPVAAPLSPKNIDGDAAHRL